MISECYRLTEVEGRSAVVRKMTGWGGRSAETAVTSIATLQHPQLMSTSVQEVQHTSHWINHNTVSSSLCEPCYVPSTLSQYRVVTPYLGQRQYPDTLQKITSHKMHRPIWELTLAWLNLTWAELKNPQPNLYERFLFGRFSLVYSDALKNGRK